MVLSKPVNWIHLAVSLTALFLLPRLWISKMQMWKHTRNPKIKSFYSKPCLWIHTEVAPKCFSPKMHTREWLTSRWRHTIINLSSIFRGIAHNSCVKNRSPLLGAFRLPWRTKLIFKRASVMALVYSIHCIVKFTSMVLGTRLLVIWSWRIFVEGSSVDKFVHDLLTQKRLQTAPSPDVRLVLFTHRRLIVV